MNFKKTLLITIIMLILFSLSYFFVNSLIGGGQKINLNKLPITEEQRQTIKKYLFPHHPNPTCICVFTPLVMHFVGIVQSIPHTPEWVLNVMNRVSEFGDVCLKCRSFLTTNKIVDRPVFVWLEELEKSSK